MTAYYFVQPTDSLFIRGNLAFGDSGEHGSGVMPPPPSLLAGAFRSAILGRDAEALAQFTRNGRCENSAMHAVLGSADKPGAFRIAWLSLAGWEGAGLPAICEPVDSVARKRAPTGETGSLEAILPLPADLVRLESGFASLTPGEPGALIQDGRELPNVAVLRSGKQEKPQGGIYLRQSGWTKHLQGKDLSPSGDGVEARHIHARDPRLGIGLNSGSRTAESGLIYTTEGYAFGSGEKESPFAATGFLVGIVGADGLIPESGFLRLGGDGRSARYQRVDFSLPPLDLKFLSRSGKFRILLQTPGVFANGWLPDGVTQHESGDYRLLADGFSARLACAAVPRREIVSGWDLFNWKPKNADRVAPAGSVYWFDQFEGDPGKLAAWGVGGLWRDNMNSARRAEGYNLSSLAVWN
jgi:CRISPR-associated protein Cmr3